MKRFYRFLMPLVTLVAMALPTTVQAQVTLTVADGTATSSYVPVYGFYADAYLQADFVYPAADLATMSGSMISSMTFFSSSSSVSWGAANFTVALKESSDATLSGFATDDGFTTVYTGALSIGADGSMAVTFTSPFLYAGGNLVVRVQNTVTGSYVSCTWLGVSATGASYQGYSYSSLSAISATGRNFLPKTTFGYVPGEGYCMPPAGLAASNVTDNSATLTWMTSDAFTNISNYTVEYGEQGFEPGTGTSTTVSTNSLSLTGLTEGTAYDVYAFTNCTDGTSDTIFCSFTTHGLPVSELPYLTGFEVGDDVAWEFNNSINAWVVDTAAHNGGSRSLYISNDGGLSNSYTISGTANSYAWREFVITDAGEHSLSFDWKASGESTYDYITVYWIPADIDMTASSLSPSSWNTIESRLNGQADWQSYQTIFNVDSAAHYYLVFRWRNDVSGGTQPPAAIDNIRLAPLSCPTPTDFAVTSLSTTGATVEWTADESENTFEVTVNGEADYISGTSYTLTDVIPGEVYSIVIRAICAADDTSFALHGSVRIPASEPVDALPYTTGFEEDEDTAWTFINDTNAWFIDSAAAFSGSRSLYISGSNGLYNNYVHVSSVSYATRDITIDEAGQFVFTMDWQAYGESSYDYLRAWLAPSGIALTPGILPDGTTSVYNFANSNPEGWIDLGGKLNLQASWQSLQTVFNVNVPGIYTLVLMWCNDNGSGSEPSATVDNINLYQLTCPAPTDLAVDAVDDESVTLSWTPGGSESAWGILVNGLDWMDVYSNPYTVSGLDANTLYTFELVAVCGADDTSFSLTTSARTACGGYTEVPYFNDFEGFSTGDVPYCWTQLVTGVNGSNTFPSVYNYSSNTYLGTGYFEFESAASSSDTEMVALPAMENINGLKMSMFVSMSATYAGILEVGVLESDGSFTLIDSLPLETFTGTNNWKQNYHEYTTYFEDYSGSGERIALRARRISGQYTIFVDNLTVSENNGCYPLASLEVTNVDSSSVTLSWVDTMNAGITYTVSYWTAGGDTTELGGISDNSYTVTGLAGSTLYNFMVTPNCSGGDGNPMLIQTRTACGTVSIPYSEDFESFGTMAAPDCWTVLGGMVYVRSSYAHSGSKYLDFRGNTSGQETQTVLLPPTSQPTNQLQVRFWTRPESFTSSSCGTFSVGYFTDLSDETTFVELANWSYDSFSDYDEKEVPMIGAPDTARIALRHNGNSYNWYWYVDDVTVEPIPACSHPVSVSASNVTTSDADITIVGTEGANYRLWWTDGTDVDSVDLATDSYSLTGLTGSTNYTVTVATLCDDDSLTASVSTSFRTACEAGSCDVIVNMEDSYGDGWNDAAVRGYVNNEQVFNATLSSGSTGSYTYSLCASDSLVLKWHTGSYDSETSFSITHGGGTVATGAGNSYSDNQVIVTLTGCPSCTAPSNLVIDTVTPNSITLGWTALGEETEWIVTVDDSVIANVNTNPYVITGLDEYTLYTLAVYAVCGEGDTSFASPSITARTTVSCPWPTNLVANVAGDTVDFSWNGLSADYQLVYGTTGFDVDTVSASNIITVTGATTYEITGLTTGLYHAYVRSICGGDYSDWTGPVNFGIGYINIDMVDTLRTCGAIICDNGGPNGDYTSSRNDQVVVYPADTLHGIRLSGHSHTEGSYDYLTIYEGVGTSGTVLFCDNTSGVSNDITVGPIDVFGPVTIAFHSDPSVYYEGFELAVTCIDLPTCPAPADITVSNLTSSSAELSWTPVGDESQWLVTVDGMGSTVVNTPYYTVTGLSGTSNYTVSLRAICGAGDTSTYASTFVFTTPMCDGGSFVPNYDTVAATGTSNYSPIGYSLYNYSYTQTIIDSAVMAQLSGDVNAFGFMSTTVTGGSQKFDGMNVYMANVPESDLSAGFILPDASHVFVQVIANSNFNFEEANEWQYHGFDSVFHWDGHSNVLFAVNRINGSWASSPSFSAHSADASKMRYVYSDGSAYDINSVTGGYTSSTVGDIMLVSCGGSACMAPTVTSTAVAEDMITIVYTDEADAYEVAIVEGAWAEPAATAIVAVSATTYTFTGLTPATAYSFAVRSVCGEGHSNWNVMTATTLEHPCDVPVNLAATNATIDGATLTWSTVDPTQTDFEVRVTGNNYDETFTVTGTSYTVTGLNANGEYTATVRAMCGVGNYSEWSAPVPFTTVACVRPSQPTAGSITANGATITWPATSNSNGNYILEYGIAGFNYGSGTSVTVNGTSYTITGLDAEYVCDVYVRSVCAEGIYSDWSPVCTFTTASGEGTYYTVTVTVNDEAMGHVEGAPTQPVEAGTVLTLTAVANDGYHFVNWNNGQTTASITFAVNGNMTVTANFAANSGIDDVDATAVSVYPNPASSDVTVKVGQPSEIMVIDMQGRTVIPATAVNSTLLIPHSSLPAGTYFLRITGDQTTLIRKLIIQ